jgi:hypothetical protein
MAVTYCTVEDVSDFMRVPISTTTTPTKAQVEKIINRKEEVLDRRIGHTFGRNKTITNEIHDLPLLYTFGWGTPIYLQHRNIRDLSNVAGDKIEVWKGESNEYDDILTDSQWYQFDPVYGRLYLRGFIFSIMRKNRIRVTYRYGDAAVPEDVEDACIKLVSIDLLTTSFRMDRLPVGGSALTWGEIIDQWKEDIESCVINRREAFPIP